MKICLLLALTSLTAPLVGAVTISKDTELPSSGSYSDSYNINEDATLAIADGTTVTGGTSASLSSNLDVDGNLCIGAESVTVTSSTITNNGNLVIYNGDSMTDGGTNFAVQSLTNNGYLAIQNGLLSVGGTTTAEKFSFSNSFLNTGIMKFTSYLVDTSLSAGSGLVNEGTIMFDGGNVTFNSPMTGGGCLAFSGISLFWVDLSSQTLDQTLYITPSAQQVIIFVGGTKMITVRGLTMGNAIYFLDPGQASVSLSYNTTTGIATVNSTYSTGTSVIRKADIGLGFDESLFSVQSQLSTPGGWATQLFYTGTSPTDAPSNCDITTGLAFDTCINDLKFPSSSSIMPSSSSSSVVPPHPQHHHVYPHRFYILLLLRKQPKAIVIVL
ncbi:uncharacterized protein NDAI_0K00380 [Naumovozyma dairenensis CBS 421]|uniref:Hyphally-regulated cell wall protein N-terminal domain-containing protein n=1 Tax=Naumovozyma dairenensis (strain ATCC 10597 / BCRC 20456 / CBS 421 / NBRC 0211 / NRRL Y-12639) TaxID=1071378 RepID=G0WHG8_NAUDC|nr:hypothetical protein NDAI_0K00380 [Naumovozyma dairenensis CBS 421]CCD27229.1 hypothetical protein NDAI_0K00380 [Naumovozyma dairenensis CBS 421]